MKHKTWLALVTIGAVTSAGALAGGMGGKGYGKGPGHQSGEARMEMHEKRFQTMDRDGDGYITREEAREHRRLMDHWQEADQNQDGRVDKSEFSAFEPQEQETD